VKKLLAALPVHAALLVGAAIALTPLVWRVAASIMKPGEASEFPPPFLPPTQPVLTNYVELFTRLSLGRAREQPARGRRDDARRPLLNSMAGYAFAKLRFPGRDRLFSVLVGALVIRRRSRCCRSS
jgi:multiple sugar transport system permease protein